MTTSSEAKSERLNIRIQPARLAKLERAAALRNQSLSEFLLASAAAAAEDAILDQKVFEISQADFMKLEKVLAAPAKKNQGLADLLASKSPWS
ncbi:MAG: DUF1778 domain-containing protein [Candidatus Planktophila sp.]